MKILDERDIIRIFKEEYDKRIASLSESVDLTFKAKVGDSEQTLISPELKVLHKNSGLRYTVDSVGLRDVILRTPEGEKFLVDGDELEREYELD